MRTTRLKRFSTAVSLGLFIYAGTAFADLIVFGVVADTGTGLGAVATLLTVQDDGNGPENGTVQQRYGIGVQLVREP